MSSSTSGAAATSISPPLDAAHEHASSSRSRRPAVGASRATQPPSSSSAAAAKLPVMPSIIAVAPTSTSVTSTTSAAAVDHDDLFARAQAMGLRTTREEYERTRAGVTAFLRAGSSTASAATSQTHASGGSPGAAGGSPTPMDTLALHSSLGKGNSSVMFGVGAKIGTASTAAARSGAAAGPSSSSVVATTAAGGGFSAYRRPASGAAGSTGIGGSTSSPMLSFFTASISHMAAINSSGGSALASPAATACTSDADADADDGAGADVRASTFGRGKKTAGGGGPAQKQRVASAAPRFAPADAGRGLSARSPTSVAAAAGAMTPRTLEQMGKEEERRRRRDKQRRCKQQQQRGAPAAASNGAGAAAATDADAGAPAAVGLGLGLGLGLGIGIDMDVGSGAHASSADAERASVSAQQPQACIPVTPSAQQQQHGSSAAGAGSRPWVSPGGTMRMVATPLVPASLSAASASASKSARGVRDGRARALQRRSPMHLAGPGAEDSPVLGAEGGGGGASRRFQQQRRPHGGYVSSGSSSSPSMSTGVHMHVNVAAATPLSTYGRAGNLTRALPLHTSRSPCVGDSSFEEEQEQERDADADADMDMPPNDSGVFFDQLDAQEEMDKLASERHQLLQRQQQQRGLPRRRARLDSADSAISSTSASAAADASASGKSQQQEKGQEGKDKDAPPSSAVLLQEEMGRMSFLDCVMQHKSSPVRLRKEAKAKERAQREWQEAMLQAQTSAAASQNNAAAATVEAQASKSVRWASSVYSPATLDAYQGGGGGGHMRLTTREHYDFINHGIHPLSSSAAAGDADGLSMLTPSMLSAPWPEAHVEMLANMSAQRAAANASASANPAAASPSTGAGAGASGDIELAALRHSSLSLGQGSPLLKMQSSTRSTTDKVDGAGERHASESPLLSSLSAFRPLSAMRSEVMHAQAQAHHRIRTPSSSGATAAVRRAVIFATNSQGQALISPVLAGSADDAPFGASIGSPIRAALGFFSASPPKAGRPWTTVSQGHRRTPTGGTPTGGTPTGGTPSLACAPFGRVGPSLAHSDVIHDSAESSAHSRESTRNESRNESRNELGAHAAASEGDHHIVSSPMVEELLAGKGGGKERGVVKDVQRCSVDGQEAESHTDGAAAAEPLMAARQDSDAASTKSAGNKAAQGKAGKGKKGSNSNLNTAANFDDASPAPASITETPARAPAAVRFRKAPADAAGVAATKYTLPAPGLVRTMEWDRADGSRLVKLVSEELQQAMEKGAIAEEPEPRFYVLPPLWGTSKAKPASASYAGLIGQAILASSDGRLSLAEIYAWINTTFPFYERGERGWQNSIRHNLSLNKSFYKIDREATLPGKGGWWAIQPGHEERFQGNIYLATPARNDASTTPSKPGKQPKTPLSTRDGASYPGTGGSNMSVDSGILSSVTGSAGQRRKRQDSGGDLPAQAQVDNPSSSGPSGTGKSVGKQPKRLKLIARRLPFEEKMSPSGNAPTTSAPTPASSAVAITPLRPAHIYAPEGSGQSAVPMLTDSASSPPSSPFYHTTNMAAPESQRPAAGRKRKAVEAVETVGAPADFPMTTTTTNLNTSSIYTAMPTSSPMHFNGSPIVIRGSTHQGKGVYTTTIPIGRGRVPASEHPASSMAMTSSLAQSPVSAARDAPGPGPGPSPGSMSNVNEQSPANIRSISLRGSPIKSGVPFSMSPTRASVSGKGLVQSHPGMPMPIHMMHMQPTPSGLASMQKALAVPNTTPARAALATAGGRWNSMTTPSPMRRVQPGQSAASNGAAGPIPWLDDPFDYQGNLQHELDFAMDSLGSVTEFTSPMRGMWPDPNTAPMNMNFTHPHQG